MENAHFDTTLCRQCRGRCCQGHPGVWSNPERFFQTFFPESPPDAITLQAFLKQGQFVLRDLGGVLVPAPKEAEQGCFFLREEGCILTAEKRPCQCLALIPALETLLDEQIHCHLPAAYASGAARRNWRPYQSLLQSLLTEENL